MEIIADKVTFLSSSKHHDDTKVISECENEFIDEKPATNKNKNDKKK